MAGRLSFQHLCFRETIRQALHITDGWGTDLVGASLCIRETIRQARADLAKLEKRAAKARKALEQKEKRLADVAASVEGVRARMAELRAELGTEMLAQLSAAERQELATLAPQLTQLQVQSRFCRDFDHSFLGPRGISVLTIS